MIELSLFGLGQIIFQNKLNILSILKFHNSCMEILIETPFIYIFTETRSFLNPCFAQKRLLRISIIGKNAQ